MATLVWPRIRERILPAARADEGGLRRVAARLALQTVVLLLVMLIALEVVVYAITQHTLRDSLVSTLKARAIPPPHLVEDVYGPGDGYGPGGPGGPGHPRTFKDTNPSEASVAWIDPHLKVLSSNGAIGTTILDRDAVQHALRTLQPTCCTVRKYQGQDYLVYTNVVHYPETGKVVGAVQTSISEHQYEETLRSLVQVLLVVALLGLLGSGGISVVLTRRALQPIRLALQRQRDFVADAAHELRTPLAIMRTAGELGIADESGEEQQAAMEQMLAENKHLTRLVDDLSLLARADSHAVAIDRAPVDLSSLVADTTAELSPLAEEQGVQLAADVDETVRVSGDIVRLRQLLLILLDNALKFTPAGGTVSVQVRPHGGRALLQVGDSGPGIDPADLPHIFDRFYRADRARTGDGSGLGLSIGKWIVEAHGGHVRAGNAPDQGASFTVDLPLAR